MEAEISSVLLLDENLKPCTPETDKSLVVRVSYNSHVPLDNLVVGLRITDLHGTNVWGTNTKRRAFALERVFGSGYVDFTIPRLPLLAGTYDLTIALSDMSEVNEFDHWDKRVRFNVNQHVTYDEGLLYVAGTWSSARE